MVYGICLDLMLPYSCFVVPICLPLLLKQIAGLVVNVSIVMPSGDG